jgi:hypothetical protein
MAQRQNGHVPSRLTGAGGTNTNFKGDTKKININKFVAQPLKKVIQLMFVFSK